MDAVLYILSYVASNRQSLHTNTLYRQAIAVLSSTIIIVGLSVIFILFLLILKRMFLRITPGFR